LSNPALVSVALFIALSLSGCSSPTPEFPINEELLPGVLIDVYVAEADANDKRNSLEAARTEALDRHGYDTTDFNETMKLLTENPEIAKKIFQSVLDSVIVEQRSIRADMLEDN
jgi:hypothetical protein